MFRLGTNSKRILNTTHEQIQEVVRLAITKTKTDFAVTSGFRTAEQQAALVAKGASQTMNSKHRTGRAVDLTPYVNGKLDPATWTYFYDIAEAMQEAAKELNINIRWGGCWEYINNKGGTPKEWVEEYVRKRKAMGKKAFIDGAHFDLG